MEDTPEYKSEGSERKPKCTFTAKGTITKDQLYRLLYFIDDMKQRGYSMVHHEREDIPGTGESKIDYKLELY